jgi:predicted alpha/beta-hydrolase family hydrolase
MPDKAMRIDVPRAGAISAMRTTATSPGAWTFVYAPGAGSNIDDPFGRYLAAHLVERGVTFVRFQFPYMEAGRRSPDRPPLLEATWRAVIDAVREPRVELCAGGRSMGGRIASQVVAQGVKVDALALFAYPLHPPGKPQQRRDAHLPAIANRTLFCSGTRDSFATINELQAASATMKRAQVGALDGADHGFSVLKSSGRTRQDVWDEALDVFLRWLPAR